MTQQDPPNLEAINALTTQWDRERAEKHATAKQVSSYPFADEATKLRVINVMKLHSITSISVSFDGSGDSGQIESVDFFTDKLDGEREMVSSTHPIHDVMLPYRERNGTVYANGKTEDVITEKNMQLRDVLEQVCYDAAEHSAPEVDWCNNDGGYGELILRLQPDGELNVRLDISQRITNTEDYSHQLMGDAEPLL